MRKFLAYSLFLFIIFSGGILFFTYKQKSSLKNLESPLPDFLNSRENSQVSTIDLWLPILKNVFTSTKPPEISARSALVYDLTTNKILYEKNSKAHLPMASLTKIMTAIIAIENKRADNEYLVHQEDLVGENVMGLEAGEVLSLQDLLYGLVLNSGNDAAEVLATNTMERSEFVRAMNDKAKSLGLKDTHFTNPSGLEGDGKQYTTSYDLLVMTNDALSHYPLFAKVVATPEYHIDATNSHKAYDLYNETNLLTSYPGVKGVKDGYTTESGLCLVTYLDYGGHKIVAILLNSDDRRGEMKELLDYSLTSEGVVPPPHG